MFAILGTQSLLKTTRRGSIFSTVSLGRFRLHLLLVHLERNEETRERTQIDETCLVLTVLDEKLNFSLLQLSPG